MGRSYFYGSGTKSFVYYLICDYRYLAACEWQLNCFANHVLVAFILGVNSHRAVAQHRFRSGSSYNHFPAAISKGVGYMPELGLFFFVGNFDVGKPGTVSRTEINDPGTPEEEKTKLWHIAYPL